jgi:hypothetical protein
MCQSTYDGGKRCDGKHAHTVAIVDVNERARKAVKAKSKFKKNGLVDENDPRIMVLNQAIDAAKAYKEKERLLASGATESDARMANLNSRIAAPERVGDDQPKADRRSGDPLNKVIYTNNKTPLSEDEIRSNEVCVGLSRLDRQAIDAMVTPAEGKPLTHAQRVTKMRELVLAVPAPSSRSQAERQAEIDELEREDALLDAEAKERAKRLRAARREAQLLGKPKVAGRTEGGSGRPKSSDAPRYGKTGKKLYMNFNEAEREQIHKCAKVFRLTDAEFVRYQITGQDPRTCSKWMGRKEIKKKAIHFNSKEHELEYKQLLSELG